MPNQNKLWKTNKLIIYFSVLLVIFLLGGLFYRIGFYHQILDKTGLDKLLCSSQSDYLYPNEQIKQPELFNKDTDYPFTFIVYGDSREPAGIEKQMIIDKIIKENPDFVVHTGDMVYYGNEHQWNIFDIFEGRIIKKGIPFYPVLGNHEYNIIESYHPKEIDKQLQLYFNRFPELENRQWYSFIYGNSEFIILDSNSHLLDSYQYDYLVEKMKDKNGFLFIFLHHPFYTKAIGKIISPERKKVAKMIKNTDIVFAADIHNYERYKIDGIDYITTAGGGANPRQINRSQDDFYNKKGATYHYCKIKVFEGHFIFQMIRLDKNKWIISDTFTKYIK